MAEIGIMGGTFDPVHNGHLLLGKQAYLEYGLDEVWFMPSGQPPHKKDHIVTEADIRCEMVRLAIAQHPHFACSEFEIHRTGNTYTAETLRLLAEEYPQHRFSFIIGADSLYEIEKWYHPELVMALTTLLVADRDYPGAERPIEAQADYLRAKYGARIGLLHCPEVDIASGELRELAARGRSIRKYVPETVYEYIQAHRLYQTAAAKEE